MFVDRREFIIKGTIASLGLASRLIGIAGQAAASSFETDLKLYFPNTGHHLSGDFLKFWRMNRNGYIFGLPITEVMECDNGFKSQYFENVRMEQSVEGGETKLSSISQEFLERHGISYSTMIDDKVDFLMQKFPNYSANSLWVNNNPSFFPNGDIHLTFWGGFKLKTAREVAPPEALDWLKDNKVYLNTLWRGEVTPVPMGAIMANEYKINIEPVVKSISSIVYDENMFDKVKKIEVDLAHQLLTAYEDNLAVMQALTSTGKPSSPTPKGNHYVWDKTYLMPYNGYNPDGNPYFLPSVTYNLKFYPETFIHATYWHNQFGQSRDFGVSLGCVNLDPYDAGWLYYWARVGTPVIIK